MKETYTTTDIEFLIATQHQDSLGFLQAIFHGLDIDKLQILIINQTTADRILKSDLSNIRVINSFETGVAKSRNLALENANGKIIIFTDDDVVYFPDTCSIIMDAYNHYGSPDCILFQAQKNDYVLLKKYPKNIQDPITLLSILNCGTIEITMKNPNLNASNFRFDDRFGINSVFMLGDEPLFLMDLKQNGKRIVFVNQTIVQHEADSTATRIGLEKRYFGLGAFYKQMFPRYHYFWLFLKILFGLKSGVLAPKEVSKALNCARMGRKKLATLPRRSQ